MVSLPHSNVAGHGLAPTVTSAAVNGDGDDDDDDDNDVHYVNGDGDDDNDVDGGVGSPPPFWGKYLPRFELQHSLQTKSIFNLYYDPKKVKTFIDITSILPSNSLLSAVISIYVVLADRIWLSASVTLPLFCSTSQWPSLWKD